VRFSAARLSWPPSALGRSSFVIAPPLPDPH
jgi:hypothetical protein